VFYEAFFPVTFFRVYDRFDIITPEAGILKNLKPCLFYLFLPQQLPGPAHPEAEPGEEPQHAVSPRPGKVCLKEPVMEEWADMSFFMFSLPQDPHRAKSPEWARRTSLVS
jgi:hypothetical protein